MDKCCICDKEAQNVIEIETKAVSEGVPLISKNPGTLRVFCDEHFWYFWDIVSALLPDGGIPLHQIGRMRELGPISRPW